MRHRARTPLRARGRTSACPGRRTPASRGLPRATRLCPAARRAPSSGTRRPRRGRRRCRSRRVPRARLALAELRRLTRLVQAGLLALDLACVAREEALALQRHAQLRVRLDESAGDAVADGTGLA